MSKRSLGLDAIRLAACLMVVAFHASSTATMPKYFGAQAHEWLFEVERIRMPLFFVLSGYLMSVLYLSRPGGRLQAQDFLLKRFKKIFPLYWLALALMSLATLAAFGAAEFLNDAPVALQYTTTSTRLHERLGVAHPTAD